MRRYAPLLMPWLLTATILAGCAALAPTPSLLTEQPPTPPLKPTLTPTAATLLDALTFRGTSGWFSPEGVYHVMGEVVNQSEHALQSVRVRGRLTDALGQTVAEGYDLVNLALLLPGEAAPFDVMLYGERVMASYTYQVWATGDGVDPAQTPYTDAVEVTGALHVGADAPVRVEGMVTNTGEVPLVRAIVQVTLYDGAGRVIGVGAAPVNGPLAPGESAAFVRTFLPTNVGGEPARHSLIAEGVRAETPAALPLRPAGSPAP